LNAASTRFNDISVGTDQYRGGDVWHWMRLLL
jgi:hypothetical protein